MTKSIRRSTLVAMLFAAAGLAPQAASAQHYYHQYNSGNYGNTSQTQWHHQQGIHVERPGAAIAGGLLRGLGQGLAAQNPQQNAVASGILPPPRPSPTLP